ncbi:hypothetical protein EJ04DRAFT_577877 [Polyplosphaeria fusca]|uniref:Alpha/beta hydrolase fold-3 domain-containing protein n=1 Tax=Polyplosphaeria fusca TaxID=682080 RepID=A0A9P4QXL9_9PLEO|nr:hypothetical protein EJ04DRAFT_577877 [Polyplosphaeria fusca]
MDVSPVGLARALIPQIPAIVTTVVLAFLRLFNRKQNDQWPQDFFTAIIVAVMRPIMSTPASLAKSQAQWLTDFGIWGPMWISKTTIPRAESHLSDGSSVVGVQEAVFRAIGHLGHEELHGLDFDVADVEVEWTGHRAGVSPIALRPNLSEKEQYNKMMQETSGECPTILYLHGGAFCLMDPATHRFTCAPLAKSCGGRCLSVRFRLSPQYTFPSALLDAFVAYLYLLSPPPGSFHQPVSSSRIVISGDSSGAGLGSALLLLLLTLRELNITHIRFHGKDVDITGTTGSASETATPPVAGLAIISPYVDVSRSLPSVYRNAGWDIIAPPPKEGPPCPNFPADAIWPTKPPRVETYCEARFVTHPLISTIAAQRSHWKGAPPVYISVGWELLQDEAEVLARRLYDAGATVIFDGYKGMPHCFQMMRWNWQGRQSMQNWGDFCRNVVSGHVKKQHVARWTDKHGAVTEVGLQELASGLGDSDVYERLQKKKERRVKLEINMRRL